MTTNKHRTLRATLLLVAAAFFAVHLLFWLLPNVFEPWNAQIVDQLFILQSEIPTLRPAYDSTIVHVNISDGTLDTLYTSYLNRTQYAEVIRNLGDMHLAAQLWDFIFPGKQTPWEDSILVSYTRQAGQVYFGLAFKFSGLGGMHGTYMGSKEYARYAEESLWHVDVEGDLSHFPYVSRVFGTYDELAHAARGVGFLNIDPDRDGVYRRVPLLVRYGTAFYPSFPFRAICDYLGVTPDRVFVRAGDAIILRGARRPEGSPHDIRIPIDREGNMVVNYIGAWESEGQSSMDHYDFAQILWTSGDAFERETWRDVIGGKIAVVSQVTTGSADVGPIPTDVNVPLSHVHASVLNTILTEQFLVQLTFVEMVGIELIVLILVSVLALRLSSLPFSLGSVSLLLVYFAVGSLLFLGGGVILDLLRPSLMVVFASFSIVAYRYVNEEKEKEVIRRSFESYFPPTVVSKIIANRESITTGGHKKELTILFSDIKSFTTYSSTMTPDEIQKMLNEYFEAMVEIVFKYGGTVDKFIGDGLMVFFGDPEPQEDHALRCVKAAIEMQKKCRELKVKWEKEGRFPLKIRIGINTGPVVVGNMGSARRLSYTVLGSDVNLAQRLESTAPVEGIMISARTFDLVNGQVPTRPLQPVKVKGLEEPIKVYEVVVDE